MTMRKLLMGLLVVSTAGLSGCLESELTLLIRPDGSGTLTDKTLFTKQTSMMLAMASSGGPGGPGEPSGPGKAGGIKVTGPLEQMTDKKAVAERAKQIGEGVTVKSVRKIKQADGRLGAEVVYAFTDANKLKLPLSPPKQGGGPGGPDMGGPAGRPQPEKKDKGEFATLKFVKATAAAPAKLTITMPDQKKQAAEEKKKPGPGDMPPEMQEQMKKQMMAMMKQMLAGLRMQVTVKTAGKVTKTNATYPLADGKGLTLLDVNFGELVKDDKAMEQMESMDDSMTLSEAKEAFNKPLMKKYIKIEMNEKTDVEFR